MNFHEMNEAPCLGSGGGSGGSPFKNILKETLLDGTWLLSAVLIHC